jgi:uncharacterized protein (TIGR00369 family)
VSSVDPTRSRSPVIEGPELPQEEAAAIHARMSSIPVFTALRFSDLVLRRGEVRCTVPWLHEYDGIYQSFHGGLLMTVADSAAAIAVLTVVGAGERLATSDMSIRFLRPVRSDATVTARVLKAGHLMVPVEANVFDDRGQLAAVAQVAYVRVPARDA